MKEERIGYYLPGCISLSGFGAILLGLGLVATLNSNPKTEPKSPERVLVSVTEVIRNEETGESIVVEYTPFSWDSGYEGLKSSWGEYVLPVGVAPCVDRAMGSFPGMQRTCVDGEDVKVVTYGGSGQVASVREGSVSSWDLEGEVDRFQRDRALLQEAGLLLF